MRFSGNAGHGEHDGGPWIRAWLRALAMVLIQGQTRSVAWQGMVETMEEHGVAPFDEPCTKGTADSPCVSLPANEGEAEVD